MLKRIKNAYKALTEATPPVGGKLDIAKMKSLYDSLPESAFLYPQGDGKAEFLGEGTHEEFLEMEKESKGLKGIFGL